MAAEKHLARQKQQWSLGGLSGSKRTHVHMQTHLLLLQTLLFVFTRQPQTQKPSESIDDVWKADAQILWHRHKQKKQCKHERAAHSSARTNVDIMLLCWELSGHKKLLMMNALGLKLRVGNLMPRIWHENWSTVKSSRSGVSVWAGSLWTPWNLQYFYYPEILAMPVCYNT